MLSASKLPKTASTQPIPTPGLGRDGNGTADRGPSIICDLAEGNAFVESYGKPHIPVMSAFGAGRLHACRLYGSWDLEQMASGYANALFRSIRRLVSKDGKETTKAWDDLTFRFGPRAFLYADENRIIGFGGTAAEAERLVAECSEKYRKPAPASQKGGEFYLI